MSDMSSSFDVAENRIFPVSSLVLKVLDGEHPFHVEERDRVAENWRREVAANPALFDGQVVFQNSLSIQDGAVSAEGHVVPFSTFLWWRRQAAPARGFHVFGFPVLVSSDGAIIAIRMGEHTANPGQVYCAAGSLDPGDIIDGHCDLLGNMRREVQEETGLDLTDAEDDGRYVASYSGRRLVVCRLFRFDRSAERLVSAVERHMDQDHEKEIAGVVAIRSADPAAQPYNKAMLPLLDWYFSGGA